MRAACVDGADAPRARADRDRPDLSIASRGLDTVDANSARLFLSVPSKMLSFWCAVLGINPADVNQVYWSLLRAH